MENLTVSSDGEARHTCWLLAVAGRGKGQHQRRLAPAACAMAACFYLELSLSRRTMTGDDATRWGAQTEVKGEHEVEVETGGEHEPRDRG